MEVHVKKCGEVIPMDTRSLISTRYKAVTKAVNREFWSSSSETLHSLYVGSYGRGTAIDTSDLDILVELPTEEQSHYDIMKGNSQSRLLQAVREAIMVTYPRSEVRADGQVVKINFYDGMKFEILPAFKNLNGSYTYPDSNMGGNWRSTNPKAEQNAMENKNYSSNGLLYDTCKHLRRIRGEHFKSYHLSGIVIDSFVYTAMGNWHWCQDGEPSSSAPGDYERILLNYFNQVYDEWNGLTLYAPGSNQRVETSNSIEGLKKVLNYIAD